MEPNIDRMTKRAAPLHSLVLTVLIFQTTNLAVFGSPAGATANNTDSIVDPDEIRYEPAPLPFETQEDWKDWEAWEASPDVVKAFPYYKMGYDLDGLAVYYIGFGKWNCRKWAQVSEEKVAEFWKYFEQLVRREEKDAMRSNGGGIVEIIDFDGFSLNKYASSKAIKLALTMFAGKMRVSNYLSYGLYVNVNFSAEMFINSARPFLSGYIDKFEIYGTRVEKWKPLVLKKISADQLIPSLGGSTDWKPAPFNR